MSTRPKRTIKAPERYSPVLEPGERFRDDISVDDDFDINEEIKDDEVIGDGRDTADGYNAKREAKKRYVRDGFVQDDDESLGEVDLDEEEEDEDDEEETEESEEEDSDELVEPDSDEDESQDDDDDEEEEEPVAQQHEPQHGGVAVVQVLLP